MTGARGEGPAGSAPIRPARTSPLPVVILNPNAGRKVGLPTNVGPGEGDLAALLEAVGLTAELRATASEAEAAAWTRAAVEAGAPAVIAAGGDGTLRVVARALLDAGAGRDPESLPALGLLPLGSVMNVGRSLSIPRELDAAAAVVAAGHVRRIDVGLVAGSEPFLEGLAIGLHAELFAEAAAFDDGDRLAPLRAAWTAVRYRPSRLTLRLDDRTVATRALVVSVANGPYVGLGFTVAPDARMDDGRLDIRVFERFSRWELVRHFASIALGRRAYEPRVRTFRSARVAIRGASPLRVRADGEDIGETPVEAEVRPGALRVIVPRS